MDTATPAGRKLDPSQGIAALGRYHGGVTRDCARRNSESAGLRFLRRFLQEYGLPTSAAAPGHVAGRADVETRPPPASGKE